MMINIPIMSMSKPLLLLSQYKEATFIFFRSCECTESRMSSSHYHHHHHHHHPHPHPHRRRRRRRSQSRLHQRRSSAPMSTFASTSYRSDDPSDDEEEDLSTIHNEEISTGILPPPDLVQSTMTEEYRHHLQQMADLSNQQRLNEQSIPFFGKDDPLTNNETSQMPTTSLEKTLLFN